MAVYFLHDDQDVAQTSVEIWKKLGINVIPITTAREALSLIHTKPEDFSVCIIHGSFGLNDQESVNVFDVARALHEQNEFTRIGIITNAYPETISDVMDTVEADFCFAQRLRPNDPWILAEIAKGPVSPEEIGRRGKTIETVSGRTSRKEI